VVLRDATRVWLSAGGGAADPDGICRQIGMMPSGGCGTRRDAPPMRTSFGLTSVDVKRG
jgi:hypothetical protein